MSRCIALSGSPASGKTTIGAILGKNLDLPFIKGGEVMRRFADERDMSLVEFERVARQDQSFDFYIDQGLRDISVEGTACIVDSRLAWHFIPSSLACHLIADPVVAARRAEGRRNQTSELYVSETEALQQTRARDVADRARFLTLYGIDVGMISNYDLVIDTTSATTDDVSSLIETIFNTVDDNLPHLWLDPRRLYPTEDIRSLRVLDELLIDTLADEQFLRENPIEVSYSAPHFLLLDGHKRASASIVRNRSLIPATLIGEGTEIVYGGFSADALQATAFLSQSKIYDWESAHNLHLWLPSA